MNGLLDFFAGLGDIVVSVFQFLFQTVKDLIYIVVLLTSLINRIPDMIGWLPSACITLVVTTFAIVLIYKIVGREG